MSGTKVKFVSRKINKIRWLPKSTTTFITGSYNDDDNIISVWKFPSQSNGHGDPMNGIEDTDPITVNTFHFHGDVTDLKVVSEEHIFASSSLGSVSILKLSEEKIQHIHTWKNIHNFQKSSAATTGIAVKGQNLASVGEDGKLCLFNITAKEKVSEIESTDPCSITCVCYLRHQEIVAGNSLGYLRLWDLRHPSKTSSSLLCLFKEQKGVTCMDIHPTQPHILASGYEDGSLCVWDMRQEKKPMSLLEAHTAAVSELHFHPINPDFLFTSSIDGSLWQWDSSKLKTNLPIYTANLEPDDTQSLGKGNTWLNCDANRHKLDIVELFSQPWTCVNSMDIYDSTLLWGTDNEALCIMNDIIV